MPKCLFFILGVILCSSSDAKIVIENYSSYEQSSCAISNNELYCWGESEFGELDIPEDLGKVTQVSTADRYTCAIKTDKSLRCWGNDGYRIVKNTPSFSNASMVATSQGNACAIDSGKVKCWGLSYGIATDSDDDSELVTPKKIVAGKSLFCGIGGDEVRCWGPIAESFQSRKTGSIKIDLKELPEDISMGDGHLCTKTKNRVDCFLIGRYQLPRYGVTFKPEKLKIPEDLGSVAYIGTGRNHTCAINEKDDVHCWNTTPCQDLSDQSCLSPRTAKSFKIRIPEFTGKPIAVHGGSSHSCLILEDKGFKCWKHSSYFKEGNGYRGIINNDFGQVHPPRPVSGKIRDFIVDSQFTCAISDSGVSCWGSNYKGSVGSLVGSGPVQVKKDLIDPYLISNIGSCVVAADRDGLQTWGTCNAYTKGKMLSELPSPVTWLKELDFGSRSVLSNNQTGCLLYQSEQKNVHCWGENPLVPYLSKPRDISVGYNYNCAQTEEGPICWNNQGVLTLPQEAKNAVSVNAIESRLCAILKDKSLFCWGGEGFSGYETVNNIPDDLGPVKQVAGGNLHTCVIQEDDKVRCFGSNKFGAHNVPTSLGRVKKVKSSYSHNCALDFNDELHCWGTNEYRQLDIPYLPLTI